MIKVLSMEKQDFIEQLADSFYLFKGPAMPGLPFSIPYIIQKIQKKKCILMDAGIYATDKEESHAIH